ncbi:oxidoreductase [Staphylococcus hominis]|nr:oxidoreductase [Staphylococcus hominis]
MHLHYSFFYKYINLMETLKNGDELKIDFDCTQATEAIPNWAAEQGYPVTNYEQLDDASWTITVQKA